jgi:hypothetical protein
MALSTNGDISFYEDTGTTAKFFWDASAESLGIGTSSPDVKFHVSGGNARIAGTEVSGSFIDINASNTGSDGATLGVSYYGSGSYGPLKFTVGGSERMRINSSGNVGIGTSSPSTKVDINNGTSDSLLTLTTNSFGGAARTGVNFQVNGFANTPSGQIAVIGNNNYSGNMVFSVANSGTTNPLAERMRIDSSGNLLVGTTTSPSGSGKLALAKGVVENTTTVTYASSIALTYDNGSIQTVTLTGNVTFTDSLADGESIVLMLNAGASYTVTWPTLTWVTSGGNVAPTLTANDTLVFWKIGSTLYGAYAGSYT